MAKEESVVRSFRVNETLYNQANEIYKKDGFAFSEVVRLLLEATVREGRTPRSLSTREIEEKMDAAMYRNAYIDNLLDSVVPYSPESNSTYTAEKRLLRTFFKEEDKAKYKSNESLREWADKWGLPENLSVATLADLYDCGLFVKDPWWDGSYNYELYCDNDSTEDAMELLRKKENLDENLDKMKHDMRVKAIKNLMESKNE